MKSNVESIFGAQIEGIWFQLDWIIGLFILLETEVGQDTEHHSLAFHQSESGANAISGAWKYVSFIVISKKRESS
jgi:hypothetical protein